MEKVNLVEKFALFDDRWSPKIAGELNGQYVKLAKLKGEFVWHHHQAEDELFFVIKGCLTMRFPEKEIVVKEGEFLIVPRGIEHCPAAARRFTSCCSSPSRPRTRGMCKPR